MADPISVLYLVLSIVSTTKQLTGFVNSIRYVDQRIDQQYYRLVAEREQTEAWANQIRLTAGDDLRSAIPTEKYDEVSELLNKLKIYYSRAEKRYSRILGVKSREERRSNLVAKLKYVAGDHEELKDLVDVIRSMNKALRAIAPPLPPYASPSPAGLSTPLAARSHTDEAATVPSGGLPSSSALYSEHVASVPLFDSAAVDISSGQSPSSSADRATPRESAETYSRLLSGNRNAHTPSLSGIFNICQKTLKEIAAHRDNDQLQNAESRLRLWAAGLFELPAPLDNVLAIDDSSPNATRKAFLSMIANILVLGERGLNRLRKQATGSAQAKLASLQSEVSSMLGTDELVESSLQRWADVMYEWSLEDQHGQQEEFVEHFDGHRLSSKMQIIDNNLPDEQTRDTNSISRTVETLFDLLPAIRGERRQFAYRLGLSEKQQETPSAEALANHTDSAIVEDLNKIEAFIRKQDERAITQGSGTSSSVPVFQKQRMRLEELQELGKRQDIEETTVDIEPDQLKNKKEEIRETVASLVAQINRSGSSKIHSPSSKPVLSSKKSDINKKPVFRNERTSGGDTKQAVEDSRSNGEKLAKDILDTLARTAI